MSVHDSGEEKVIVHSCEDIMIVHDSGEDRVIVQHDSGEVSDCT